MGNSSTLKRRTPIITSITKDGSNYFKDNELRRKDNSGNDVLQCRNLEPFFKQHQKKLSQRNRELFNYRNQQQPQFSMRSIDSDLILHLHRNCIYIIEEDYHLEPSIFNLKRVLTFIAEKQQQCCCDNTNTVANQTHTLILGSSKIQLGESQRCIILRCGRKIKENFKVELECDGHQFSYPEFQALISNTYSCS